MPRRIWNRIFFMDLKELLGGSHIGMRKEDFGRVIGSSPEMYRDLMNIALSQELPVCWRAAWIMDHLSELHPSLPEKYIEQLWRKIPDQPDGVKRSILRMLCRYEIPEEQQGIATDMCLDWLLKESVPVAIKVFSMEILLNITRVYPELKEEFITILEDQMPNNSAGYKARAVKIIKAMEKL